MTISDTIVVCPPPLLWPSSYLLPTSGDYHVDVMFKCRPMVERDRKLYCSDNSLSAFNSTVNCLEPFLVRGPQQVSACAMYVCVLHGQQTHTHVSLVCHCVCVCACVLCVKCVLCQLLSFVTCTYLHVCCSYVYVCCAVLFTYCVCLSRLYSLCHVCTVSAAVI